MTAVARSPREADTPRGIDVRCSAGLPRGDGHEGRCQLFAGHDGPHAVMFAHGGHRMVRNWTDGDRRSAAVDCRTMQHLPWMYGYPTPAWFETEASASG